MTSRASILCPLRSAAAALLFITALAVGVLAAILLKAAEMGEDLSHWMAHAADRCRAAGE